jgi:hypothetical protein
MASSQPLNPVTTTAFLHRLTWAIHSIREMFPQARLDPEARGLIRHLDLRHSSMILQGRDWLLRRHFHRVAKSQGPPIHRQTQVA